MIQTGVIYPICHLNLDQPELALSGRQRFVVFRRRCALRFPAMTGTFGCQRPAGNWVAYSITAGEIVDRAGPICVMTNGAAYLHISVFFKFCGGVSVTWAGDAERCRTTMARVRRALPGLSVRAVRSSFSISSISFRQKKFVASRPYGLPGEVMRIIT